MISRTSGKTRKGGSHSAVGRQSPDAWFPTAPTKVNLPREYADALGAIKQRIQEERLRVVLAANATMISLYWDIG